MIFRQFSRNPAASDHSHSSGSQVIFNQSTPKQIFLREHSSCSKQSPKQHQSNMFRENPFLIPHKFRRFPDNFPAIHTQTNQLPVNPQTHVWIHKISCKPHLNANLILFSGGVMWDWQGNRRSDTQGSVHTAIPRSEPCCAAMQAISDNLHLHPKNASEAVYRPFSGVILCP